MAGLTVTTAATGTLRPVGALGYPGRFAIYDPDLLDPSELSSLDPPDNNAVGDPAMPSIQGYSSTVDGFYASVTGSHQAAGMDRTRSRRRRWPTGPSISSIPRSC